MAAADLVWVLPVQQALAAAAPPVVLAWWQRVDRRATFRLRWPAGGGGRGWVCLAGAIVCGGGLFLVGAAALIAVRGPHLTPAARELAARLGTLVATTPWWLSWLLVAVLPAVCEEALFRGWLLAAFAGPRPGRNRACVAVVAQAACFAAFHLLPERMPHTFAVGLLLGWLTLRSGSILPAILGHLAHNSVPLVLHAATAGQAARLTAALSGDRLGLAVGCLAIGLAAVWLATRARADADDD